MFIDVCGRKKLTSSAPARFDISTSSAFVGRKHLHHQGGQISLVSLPLSEADDDATPLTRRRVKLEALLGGVEAIIVAHPFWVAEHIGR